MITRERVASISGSRVQTDQGLRRCAGNAPVAVGDMVTVIGGLIIGWVRRASARPIVLNEAGIYFFDDQMNMVCYDGGTAVKVYEAVALWQPPEGEEWLSIYPEKIGNKIYPFCNYINSDGTLVFLGVEPAENYRYALTDGERIVSLPEAVTIGRGTGAIVWQLADDDYVMADIGMTPREVVKVYRGGLENGISLHREITKEPSDGAWFRAQIEAHKWAPDAANLAFAGMQTAWEYKIRHQRSFWEPGMTFGSGQYNFVIDQSREADRYEDENGENLPAPYALYHCLQSHNNHRPLSDDGTYWEELGIVLVYDNPLISVPGNGTNAGAGIIGRTYLGAYHTFEEDENGYVRRIFYGTNAVTVSLQISQTIVWPTGIEFKQTCRGENIDSAGVVTVVWDEVPQWTYDGGMNGPEQPFEICINGAPCGGISPKPITHAEPHWCAGGIECVFGSYRTLEVDGDIKAISGAGIPSAVAPTAVAPFDAYPLWWGGVQEIGRNLFSGDCASWNNGKPIYYYFACPSAWADLSSAVPEPATGDPTYLGTPNISYFDGFAKSVGDFRIYGNGTWIHKSGVLIPNVNNDTEYPVWIDAEKKYCLTSGPNLPLINIETGERTELKNIGNGIMTYPPRYLNVKPEF